MESKVRKGIGLVAHDAMKKDLIEWVLWNSELLMGNKFYCTGTTGTLILKALKEKHPDEEWDFTILKSGPLGGDQQMGSRIVDGQIDYLFFFTDPMTLQPHDTDVKALTRLAGVENIVFCCNRSTADHIISSPLFTIVAESIVIFLPMLQFGCFNASASVTFLSSSLLIPLNGPPEAVRRILFSCDLFSPLSD